MPTSPRDMRQRMLWCSSECVTQSPNKCGRLTSAFGLRLGAFPCVCVFCVLCVCFVCLPFLCVMLCVTVPLCASCTQCCTHCSCVPCRVLLFVALFFAHMYQRCHGTTAPVRAYSTHCLFTTCPCFLLEVLLSAYATHGWFECVNFFCARRSQANTDSWLDGSGRDPE